MQNMGDFSQSSAYCDPNVPTTLAYFAVEVDPALLSPSTPIPNNSLDVDVATQYSYDDTITDSPSGSILMCPEDNMTHECPSAYSDPCRLVLGHQFEQFWPLTKGSMVYPSHPRFVFIY